MKAKSALIAAVAAVGIASTAQAQNYTSAGGAALTGGTVNIDIVITDFGIIQDIDVTTLFASHTYMGDVNASITHVGTGTTVSLFGFVGGAPFGDSSDLIGAYRFDDTSVNSFWGAAATATPAAAVAPGTYFATAVGANTKTFLSAFNGENINGTWRLTLTDTYAAADNGALTNWTLHATVPAPGALALLGLAGMVGARRRRR